MNRRNSVLTALLILTLWIVGLIWTSYVSSLLWLWLVTPIFRVPPVSVGVCLAVLILAAYVRSLITKFEPGLPEDDTVVHWFFNPFAWLCIGYAASFWV